MYDDDPFQQMAAHEDHSSEFMRPFIGGLIGGYIGHQLSKTRLGQRFENSKIVGWIIGLILLAVGGYLVFCAGAFVVILIHVMLLG